MSSRLCQSFPWGIPESLGVLVCVCDVPGLAGSVRLGLGLCLSVSSVWSSPLSALVCLSRVVSRCCVPSQGGIPTATVPVGPSGLSSPSSGVLVPHGGGVVMLHFPAEIRGFSLTPISGGSGRYGSDLLPSWIQSCIKGKKTCCCPMFRREFRTSHSTLGDVQPFGPTLFWVSRRYVVELRLPPPKEASRFASQRQYFPYPFVR